MVSAATFLLFALSAALFSAVNERTLRHSRSQLELLVELGAELERALRHDDVVATLVRHSCGAPRVRPRGGARPHRQGVGRRP